MLSAHSFVSYSFTCCVASSFDWLLFIHFRSFPALCLRAELPRGVLLQKYNTRNISHLLSCKEHIHTVVFYCHLHSLSFCTYLYPLSQATPSSISLLAYQYAASLSVTDQPSERKSIFRVSSAGCCRQRVKTSTLEASVFLLVRFPISHLPFEWNHLDDGYSSVHHAVYCAYSAPAGAFYLPGGRCSHAAGQRIRCDIRLLGFHDQAPGYYSLRTE